MEGIFEIVMGCPITEISSWVVWSFTKVERNCFFIASVYSNLL